MHINILENSYQKNFSRLKFEIKYLFNLKKAILETILPHCKKNSKFIFSRIKY
jgi:hypothetical protein